jgi:SAM-dependent methyltransferase
MVWRLIGHGLDLQLRWPLPVSRDDGPGLLPHGAETIASLPGSLPDPDLSDSWVMNPGIRPNRIAWEAASQKHVREYQELLRQARSQSSLLPHEADLLRPLLGPSPAIVHLQSGHGLDDIALVAMGAGSVVGIDFSEVAVTAAQRRADDLGAACRYVIAEVPGSPLRDECADLVYTGKGALIWLPDLGAWARDAARLLRSSGHLFVYEAHPLVPLWSWDEDEPRIRPERGYFERCHVNDTFPARGAVQWQATLGEIINAVISAGLELRYVAEYAEPFWRPGGAAAAAWRGQLPNSFALIAQHRRRAGSHRSRAGS